MGRDASIIIQEVKFIYNGTFVCQVKNPPDVHGPSGEIRLRVVTTGLPPHSKQNILPSFQWWEIIALTCSWNVAVFPCHLLISSLVLRSSPAGVGYRRGHRRRRLVPHHRFVLQAVQEEETKAARKMRGGPPQREKRPYSVVRVRGEGRGGGSVGEEWHTSSLTPILTLGMRAGVRPSRGRGVDSFPAGYTTSTSFHNCTLWI